MSTRQRRRVTAAFVGLAATLTMTPVAGAAVADRAGSAAPAASTGASDQVNAPVPALHWTRCYAGLPYLCATPKAPLDYDDPTGPTVVLDLVKVPATDPKHRLGTIFVNPGGPGGSASGFAPDAATYLGKAVTARYDVIGIDPRGVGVHTPMVCRTDQPAPTPFTHPFPVTVKESGTAWRTAQWFRAACSNDPGRIVAHMSTADTARDMDLIRQAVGDRRLNYYGISYGTFLGTSYAAMFPSRVGRLVVDSVLDPVQWSTGTDRPPFLPFSTRIKSARGADESLTSAFVECDRVGRGQCPFAGNAPAKWAKLAAKAKSTGLDIGMDTPMTYADLIGGVVGNLYGHNYHSLAAALQAIYDANVGGRVAKADLRAAGADLVKAHDSIAVAPYTSPLADGQRKVGDAFSGVACSDTRNPRTQDAWWNAGRMQDKDYPGFGSLWTWASATCGGWPGTTMDDSFLGPYDVKTANPVLVINNRYDPATPIQGAQRVNRLLAGSRLLTTREHGHGALDNTCVGKQFTAYFLSGKLPAVGMVCPADAGLFATS